MHAALSATADDHVSVPCGRSRNPTTHRGAPSRHDKDILSGKGASPLLSPTSIDQSSSSAIKPVNAVTSTPYTSPVKPIAGVARPSSIVANVTSTKTVTPHTRQASPSLLTITQGEAARMHVLAAPEPTRQHHRLVDAPSSTPLLLGLTGPFNPLASPTSGTNLKAQPRMPITNPSLKPRTTPGAHASSLGRDNSHNLQQQNKLKHTSFSGQEPPARKRAPEADPRMRAPPCRPSQPPAHPANEQQHAGYHNGHGLH